MKPELTQAVLRRGGHRCAWCACALDTGKVADRGVVCQLDLSGDDSSMVTSCVACNAEFVKWWPYTIGYSVETARRILGRHNGIVLSGPFVTYLDLTCKFDADIPERCKIGLQTPFTTALARIEAQRNAPLDVRKVRAA